MAHEKIRGFDFSKPFPCGECGKMVMSNEEHTLDDCNDYTN